MLLIKGRRDTTDMENASQMKKPSKKEAAAYEEEGKEVREAGLIALGKRIKKEVLKLFVLLIFFPVKNRCFYV